jgi:hypothetical protein
MWMQRASLALQHLHLHLHLHGRKFPYRAVMQPAAAQKQKRGTVEMEL